MSWRGPPWVPEASSCSCLDGIGIFSASRVQSLGSGVGRGRIRFNDRGSCVNVNTVSVRAFFAAGPTSCGPWRLSRPAKATSASGPGSFSDLSERRSTTCCWLLPPPALFRRKAVAAKPEDRLSSLRRLIAEALVKSSTAAALAIVETFCIPKSPVAPGGEK